MGRSMALLAALGLLSACGGGSGERHYVVTPEAKAIADSAPDPACAQLYPYPNLPEHRFVPIPEGVPEAWIVMLKDGPADLVAQDLVRQHGGILKHVWTATPLTTLNGFSVHDLPEDGALLMSIDPRVCWVEQDGYTHI